MARPQGSKSTTYTPQLECDRSASHALAVLLEDAAIAFADARLHALKIAMASLPGRPSSSWSREAFTLEIVEAFAAGAEHRGASSASMVYRIRQHADGYLEGRMRALQVKIGALPAAAITDDWSRRTLKDEIRDAFLAGAQQATALSRGRAA